MCTVVVLQSMFEKANPSRQGPRVSQSALITATLKPYQLASVSWMADIERRTEVAAAGGGCHGDRASGGDWLCSHVMKCQSSGSSLLFDVINNRILCEPVSADSPLASFTVRVKGGILAGMCLYV